MANAPNAQELYRELSSGLRKLLQKSPPPLATPESAAYFRNWAKGRSLLKAPQKKEPIQPPQPSQAPPPQIQSPPSEVASLPPPKPEKAPPRPRSFQELWTLFAQIAPDYPLMERPPSDEEAKKRATLWKTKNQCAPLSILSYQESGEQRLFLEQIAHTLDLLYSGSKLISAEPIEKEKRWDAFLAAPGLKLVIASDSTLWQLNALRSFYKENIAQEGRVLGKIPLFLLPDLSLYLKDPLLKRSLMKGICQKLSL